MRVLSVNTGRAVPFANATGATAIHKRPQEGRVRVTTLGLEGDEIADRVHHGGPEQAVYLYGAPDLLWWEAELGRAMPPGLLGENLTVTEFFSAEALIGDRFTIGDLVLEVTAPRIPCATLAARMGNPGFVRRFYRAGRPGVYARVVREGTAAAGDPVVPARFPGEAVRATELLECGQVRDAAEVERVLRTPLHAGLRAVWEARRVRTDEIAPV